MDQAALALASFEKAIEEIKALDAELQQLHNLNARYEGEISGLDARIIERTAESERSAALMAEAQAALFVQESVLRAHEAVSSTLHAEMSALDRQLEAERAAYKREKAAFVAESEAMRARAARVQQELEAMGASTWHATPPPAAGPM